MTGKAHVAIGTALTATLAYKTNLAPALLGGEVYLAIAVLAATPGSYLPDIDHQQSHYGRKVQVVSKHMKHRGITHTLLIPALVAIAHLFLLQPPIPLGVASKVVRSITFGLEVGYLAHLVADMFNGAGIPLLWPISKSKIHIMDLDSSGWQCMLFTILCVGGCALCFLM